MGRARRICISLLVTLSAPSAWAEPATPPPAPVVVPAAPPVAPPAPVVAPAAPPAVVPPPAPVVAPAAPPVASPGPQPVDDWHDPVPVGPEPAAPAVGSGFHLFDKQYLLFGFNWQRPCASTSFELEVSYVPLVTNGMWWFGVYSTSGFQVPSDGVKHRAPSEETPCFKSARDSAGATQTPDAVLYDVNNSSRWFRFGTGLEGGWRMIGLDAGLVYNSALKPRDAETDRVVAGEKSPTGYRFRLGLALSDEAFTGAAATYGRSCCPPGQRATGCECRRTPVGVSLFLYYANELYVQDGRVWDDGMVGLSLKIGVGL